jgi:hypothetical protein
MWSKRETTTITYKGESRLFLWITITSLEFPMRNKLMVRRLRKMMNRYNTKAHSIRERLMQILKEENQEEVIA